MRLHQQISIIPVLGCALLAMPVLAQDSTAQPSAQGQSGSAATQSSSKPSSGSGQVSAKDKAFMKAAAQGGMEEVELGQMVADKAKNEDVKQFAQRMVQDHSKANDELKALAQEKGVTLPTDLSAEGKSTKARLEKLSGDQLDKAYMHSMVMDHNKDVHEFKTATTTVKDPDLKSWAEKTLPTLQEHLKQAKEVASKTGATTAKTSQTAQQ